MAERGDLDRGVFPVWSIKWPPTAYPYLATSYKVNEKKEKWSHMLARMRAAKGYQRCEYPDSQQRIKKESFICVLASSIVPDPVLVRFSFSLLMYV